MTGGKKKVGAVRIEAKSRKEERREKRKVKKRGQKSKHPQPTAIIASVSTPLENSTKNIDRQDILRGSKKRQVKRKTAIRYRDFDEETAAALRADDEEIARLEKKLGIVSSNSKDRSLDKLNREYAKLEGYGDDFGDFLVGLDSIWNSSDHDDENSEELVPMKEPQESSSSSSTNNDDLDDSEKDSFEINDSESDNDSFDEDDDDMSEDGDDKLMADMADTSMNTYTPEKGQDIYGNSTEKEALNRKHSKYIPPHMRSAHNESNNSSNVLSSDLQQDLVVVQRLLNGMLNRLAESSMDSVVMQIKNLYTTEARWKVNQCLTERLLQVCVHPTQLMTTLIPTYAATIAALHATAEDGANSIGGHVIETITVRYLEQQQEQQQVIIATNNDDEECFLSKKESANLILIITYLYNFRVVHCTFIYDIIRELIQNLNEVNVELLLIILQHSGYQLRSDDPTALKDIVLLVQQQKQPVDSNNSRIQFFLAAIADLKNNKKNNPQHAEKLARYRKFLGRVKSSSANNYNSTCLRITLQDIRDIPTAGRWWRVGNAWKGNSFLEHTRKEEGVDDTSAINDNEKESKDGDPLLQLAAKLGMNTDLRRSIFCVLMGSTDCDDAFEKLVKLKNGSLILNKQQHLDREVSQVLIECCGQEKIYNPFYAFFAIRFSDTKSKKFTFQKTYWDNVFPLFEQNMKARKAANLAKLAAHLVKERKMSITVLKVLDMTDLPEAGLIFLTVFFATMFQTCDSEQVESIFSGITRDDSGVALKQSLSVFLLKYLEKSPKNVSKSPFRKCFKAAIKVCKSEGVGSLDSMF
mmetsp:Transcript_16262/g.23220  ORF Transcript_16262/g.23220 Transcript_16262/m.23220 type:complete len:810 (-) Transcript_16262:258-2687(-)|eukprot:CAMPEP_0172421354 /NCGR_PEP_ID=MMETSP1064-20121228/7599_1 /TAXON_ID=202472 /ORGANISM="Aulacoseira subarctica , Strain CCAP 1002/5" /LENGTH=809 /DNA_ID=CAMNT_0013161703 /DNA_START=178 /DNA_END=2607 /DNA_ORIENTATION=+